ncbi:hypothetical protein [Brachybacterium paraconglomeratum]|uniref:hypothetical protein n=1 Tax=Brachybacterium paraconglomeratum TaxID=173362 RepID=UPI0022AF9EF8|nr:hypothetical protein [Brachybacterium paraconglomeratum]MCZ4325212.1 hypothetical protein [Brachybacterium paraconglomeratum]
MLDVNAQLLVLLPLIASGIGWLVIQSYRRSDTRQAQMIELYKKQADEAEARAEAAEKREDRAWAKARAYWRLLIEHGIDPIPPIEDGDDL